MFGCDVCTRAAGRWDVAGWERLVSSRWDSAQLQAILIGAGGTVAKGTMGFFLSYSQVRLSPRFSFISVGDTGVASRSVPVTA